MPADERELSLAMSGVQNEKQGGEGSMRHDDVTQWQDRFIRAWEGQDTDLFLTLFTEDASYQDTPFTQPFLARNFRTFWDGLAREQSDNRMWFTESFLLPDRRALAIWNCLTNSLRRGGQRVEANGVMLLAFAADGRCRELREWQHWRFAGAPLETRSFPG